MAWSLFLNFPKTLTWNSSSEVCNHFRQYYWTMCFLKWSPLPIFQLPLHNILLLSTFVTLLRHVYNVLTLLNTNYLYSNTAIGWFLMMGVSHWLGMYCNGYPIYHHRTHEIHASGYFKGHYECHINVGVCISVRASKHIHKKNFMGQAPTVRL